MKKKQPSSWWESIRGQALEIVSTVAEFESEFPTVPHDGVPWDISPVPEKIVAIGDIHGDLEALATLLRESQLINEQGEWSGGASHLVLLGDLIGGNKDSRLLLNFLMRLEKEAAKVSGQVHALLGNHDILPVQGDLKKFSRSEKKKFEKVPVPGARGESVEDAFRGHSIYAKWIRSRNAILKIGETLFVHAGLDRWALESDPGRINSTIRSWIRYWQGVDIKPKKKTRWTVGKPGMRRGSRLEMGPLWIRSFKVKKSAKKNEKLPGPPPEIIEKILELYSACRIVVGHSPVDSGKVLLDHPHYGEKIVMLDTRLSDRKHGSISAIEITALGLRDLYVQRTSDGLEIRDLEQEGLKESNESLIKQILKKMGL